MVAMLAREADLRAGHGYDASANSVRAAEVLFPAHFQFWVELYIAAMFKRAMVDF
jgi:hypothetical protein